MRRIWLSMTALLALQVTGAGQAQSDRASVPPPPKPFDGNPSRAKDASGTETLARSYGLGAAEARERVRLMKLARDLRGELSRQEAATFAELSIRQEPTFQVIVGFTDGDEAKLAKRQLDPQLRRYIKVRKAKHTKVSRIADIKRVLKSIHAQGLEANAWIDDENDAIVVQTPDLARLQEAVSGGKISLPTDTRLQQGGTVKPTAATVPSGQNPPTSADYVGPGYQFYNRYKDGQYSGACTWGFKASYNGQVGLLTAGHCENRVSPYTDADVLGTGYWQWNNRWIELYAPTLEFNVVYVRGGTGDKYDFQFHPMPVWTIYTEVHIGNNEYVRVVSVEDSRLVGPGDLYCKYGISSGYKCGTIRDANFFWSGDQSYGYWRWRGLNNDAFSTAGGDSGGPVFTQPDFGTVIAAAMQVGQVDIVETVNGVSRTFRDSVQMPIDYVDDRYPVVLATQR